MRVYMRVMSFQRWYEVLVMVLAGSLGIRAASASEDLGAHYAALQEGLRQEIKQAVPALEGESLTVYNAAREAVAAAQEELESAQQNLGKINSAQGLVGHARNHWIRGAERRVAQAQQQLADAATEEERYEARAALASAEQNKRDGEQALEERLANLDAVRENEPAYRAAHEAAQISLREAGARLLQATRDLPVADVVKSDALDAQLVRFVVIEEWGSDNMAAFAAQGAEQKALLEKLLGDTGLMREMLVADGAKDGNYGRAMEIYTAIQQASPHAREGALRRLALAIALEHATPIRRRNPQAATDAPEHVDPIGRYKHFEKAYLDGELDATFDQHDVWHYRWVVDGYEPDEILTWGREMLRNYRPDHIHTSDQRWRYVATVRTEVRYGSQYNKYDRDDLHFFQNILMNGGICGRRAFFGRFILRAFGIPTTARPSPGHGALVRWTPDGWVPVLGPGWGSGSTHTPYGRDRNFLYTTQARAAGESFLQVKRAQWIGRAMGEPPVWGVGGRVEPSLWHALALHLQKAIIDEAQLAAQDAVGEELGEAEVEEEEVVKSAAAEEREEIVVHADGRITIPAVATTKPTQSTSKIVFMKSYLGGRQLHYNRGGAPQDFVYTLDAPRAGTYGLSLRFVTVTGDQPLQVTVNDAEEPVAMLLPLTLGMWQTFGPVDVDLDEGENTLRFFREGENIRGLTIKDFTLTPKN